MITKDELKQLCHYHAEWSQSEERYRIISLTCAIESYSINENIMDTGNRIGDWSLELNLQELGDGVEVDWRYLWDIDGGNRTLWW